MGDLLMSSPAIRALKQSFACRITVLTSSMAAGIAQHIPDIDEVIVADLPWVKSDIADGGDDFLEWVRLLRSKHFDAAVVFTVYSQNPVPSIMLAYLAGIPERLAYCRENPYHLLTDWVPEQEPYSFIRHQVRRDLDLVATVGATVREASLSLTVPNSAYAGMMKKSTDAGINLNEPWILVHPGASEMKRQYSPALFNQLIESIVNELNLHVILTGTAQEKLLTEHLRTGLGDKAISLGGLLSLEEFMALIDIAPTVLTVNTATVHIAAALKTPVLVLYALTNPQHTPWMVEHQVFPFAVEEELRSKNEVLRYVSEKIMEREVAQPDHRKIIEGIKQFLKTAPLRPAVPQ